MNRWVKFIGSSDEFSVEMRLFHAICLVVTAALVAASVFNLILGLPLTAMLLTLPSIFLPLLLFYLSRYKLRYKLAKKLFLVLCYAFTITYWYYNAGLNGFIHLILFCIIIWQVVFSSTNNFFWFILNLIVASLLACTALFYPEWVVWNYRSETGKVLDFLLTYSLLAASTYLIIRVLVTEYKKEKESAHQMFADLIQLNIELKDTIQEMDKANTTRNKLFSVVSHDIRSFSSNIYNFSELLLESENTLNSKELKYLGYIRESSHNLNNVLENLLSWAKIQMSSVTPSPVKISLKEVTQKCYELYRPWFEQKNITAKLELKDLFVFADIDMINSIVRNLISNAIKFTATNGLVTIDLCNNASKDIAELIITDNGIGMTKEEIEMLQHPEVFYTTSGTQREKGSGLGFIISKEFAELNNGAIYIESIKDKGSSFTLSLPLA
jgi:two-component system, sensor histidine kinase and response regulator